MKILKILRKNWLIHRVYKYTLKYNNSLSKADYYCNLAKCYSDAALCEKRVYGSYSADYIKFSKSCQEFDFKGNRYKNLADIYLNKKIDLEEELGYYRKV